MAKPQWKVILTNLPCSCGGVLRPYKLNGEYDATAEMGLPTLVRGSILLVKCDQCEGVALPGSLLETLSDEAVLVLLKLQRRLSGPEAKFLRKAALAIGQEELSSLLGVTRVTVARWEGQQSLSAPQDFELRGLIVARLLSMSQLGNSRWKRRRVELSSLVTKVLDSVRTVEAPASPPPLSIAA